MFLICCLIHWVCSWHVALVTLPNKSTATTYTEWNIRKKSCLNYLLYNWWKHFKIHFEILFSVWSFISSNSPPPMKISKIPLLSLFSPPLILKNARFCWVKKSNPPPSQRVMGGEPWCNLHASKSHSTNLVVSSY